HCGSIRQTATIISIPVENLRTGDRANVLFRFLKSPEYLRLGMKLIFREGRTKAIGSISKLIPYVAPQVTGNRIKTRLQTAVSITTDQLQINKRTDTDSNDPNQAINKRSKQIKTTSDNNISVEQNSSMDKNITS
ncbi:unnamed protein product, partial [Rotaria sp. Silwood2]